MDFRSAIILPEAEPVAPASGDAIFARVLANRRMLSWKQPDTEVYQVQPFFARNRVAIATPPGGGGAGIGVMGSAFSLTGGTGRNSASTNLFTSQRRLGLVTAATASAYAGIRGDSLIWYRGNAAGRGGFMFICRFGISHAATVAQARAFVGLMATSVAPLGTDTVSAKTDILGIGFDSAETVFSTYKNDAAGAAVKSALSANFPSNSLSTDWYELIMYCKPFDTTVYWRMERLNMTIPLAYDDPTRANYIASGDFGTTDLPANTTFLAPHGWIGNGSTALAAAMDVGIIYMESDT